MKSIGEMMAYRNDVQKENSLTMKRSLIFVPISLQGNRLESFSEFISHESLIFVLISLQGHRLESFSVLFV